MGSSTHGSVRITIHDVVGKPITRKNVSQLKGGQEHKILFRTVKNSGTNLGKYYGRNFLQRNYVSFRNNSCYTYKTSSRVTKYTW